MGDIDVVIVAYRSAADLPTCLGGALRIADAAQVVVVDHGTDGAAEVARSMGAHTISDPSNPGFAAGQNRGFALGSAPYVLVLNPDATVEPDAIRAGVRWLANHPDVAAVQGVILAGNGRPERSAGRMLAPVHLLGRALGLRFLLSSGTARRLATLFPVLSDHVHRIPLLPISVEALAATALLIRRDAFASVAGFDPGYFLYGEDLDLSRRLSRAGWRLVAMPEVWARHRNGASSASSMARELHWWRGTLRFAAREWSPPAWAAARVASLLMWARIAARAPMDAPAAWRTILTAPRRDRLERSVLHRHGV